MHDNLSVMIKLKLCIVLEIKRKEARNLKRLSLDRIHYCLLFTLNISYLHSSHLCQETQTDLKRLTIKSPFIRGVCSQSQAEVSHLKLLLSVTGQRKPLDLSQLLLHSFWCLFVSVTKKRTNVVLTDISPPLQLFTNKMAKKYLKKSTVFHCNGKIDYEKQWTQAWHCHVGNT